MRGGFRATLARALRRSAPAGRGRRIERYLLPAAGAGAAGLGVAVAWGSRIAPPEYAAPAIVAAIGGAVGLAYLFRAPLPAPPPRPGPARRSPARTPAARRVTPGPPAPRPPALPFAGTLSAPTGSAPLPWWTVTTTQSSPGDQLWRQWLPGDSGALPVDLIGPVPETVGFPLEGPGCSPFAAREVNLFRVDFVPPVIEPYGDAAGSVETGVLQEAFNPIPPAQRIPPTIASGPGRAARSAPAPVPRAACASCTNSLLDLRKWGPCPACLQPVCSDCLLEAMAVSGRGWCSACVEEPRGGAG